MFDFLKKLFNIPTINLQELVQQGASIIDVRSASEFQSGHIPQSINIPIDQIGNHIEKIKKMKQPIITCCASGMRSAAAKATLQAKGIENFNGGNWYSLQQKIDS